MTSILTDLVSLFKRFEVDVILIGGWAAILHGSARSTIDVDFVYSRDEQNLQRLARALSDLHPYPRGAPPGLPFTLDQRTLESGLNFTLTTDLGAVDLLGEAAGNGTYENLLAVSDLVNIEGIETRCVNLKALIQLKKAAGRPKDLEAIAELQELDRRNDRN